MTMLRKGSVKLGGVPLAANTGAAWRLTTGVTPYTTTFQVHRDRWDRLESRKGQQLDLEITDARGETTIIKGVFILHEVPSDSPYRVSFLVADRRWRWPYRMISRDYNVPRRTGDLNALSLNLPVQQLVTVEEFDYLAVTLDEGRDRWTPERIIEDVMTELEGEGGRWRIRSLPIEGDGEIGKFTIQGLTLRDGGDVALARALRAIPGADVFIDTNGDAVIFDASDLDEPQQWLDELPPLTYAGEKPVTINRETIRPQRVDVYYQREIEALFEFEDNFPAPGSNPTATPRDRNEPFLSNVLPTVDPSTIIDVYDPESGTTVQADVPVGTWVEVSTWLAAMDATKPAGSLPWTFETIRAHWIDGRLDLVLGGAGLPEGDQDANFSARIQALKQHFRQTFQISRRYMTRIRDIAAMRVALLNPLTGQRAPAAVWGQATVKPSAKGQTMGDRFADGSLYRNIDTLARSAGGQARLIETTPSPAEISFIDKDVGIFRVNWQTSPYGEEGEIWPSQLVDSQEFVTAATLDLEEQNRRPMAPGIKFEGGTNGIFLSRRMKLKVLLTIIPLAPNSKKQHHRLTIEPSEVREEYRGRHIIEGGLAPPIEVFVPPSEQTARFAYSNEGGEAEQTLRQLLGLEEDDPTRAGFFPGEPLPDYVLTNENRGLQEHARAVAAEMLAPYADSVAGAVSTITPSQGLDIRGNMSGTSIRIGSFPSARVDVVSQFSGEQRPISRFSQIPSSVRPWILGTIPFRDA